jgi:hypothetical protein
MNIIILITNGKEGSKQHFWESIEAYYLVQRMLFVSVFPQCEQAHLLWNFLVMSTNEQNGPWAPHEHWETAHLVCFRDKACAWVLMRKCAPILQSVNPGS